MPSVEFPCGQEGVLELLPHRDPFVWVTRIIECEPGKHIIAELDVAPDLPLFQGHFPGQPIFPGVIVMEALAQAACCCIMADPERQASLGYLAGIDGARFREMTLPGDTIQLEAEIVSANSRFCKAQVTARKGDKLVAEATQRYIMAKE